jgi:hypothetical protein
VTILTIALAAVFFLEGGLHLYWGLTGKMPEDALIPRDEDGIRLFDAEPLMAIAGGVMQWSSALIVVLPGTKLKLALAVLLLLRAMGELNYIGFFKRVRSSRYATFDTWLYSPLSLAQAVGLYWLTRLS